MDFKINNILYYSLNVNVGMLPLVIPLELFKLDKKVFILAPVSKKPSPGPTGKSGIGKSGASGKNPGGKIITTSKVSSSKTSATVPNKITAGSSGTSGKSYAPMPYSTPKSNKSTTFGVIWLPSRKYNKKKETVYNSHRNDFKERRPSMFNFMSGDSDKKEDNSEEKDLLVPDRLPVAIGATATVMEPAVIPTQPEEKQGFIDSTKNKEESTEALDDSPKKEKADSDYLATSESMDKSLDGKWEKDRGDKGDNVDSVYLRSPRPDKARSNTSTPTEEEEDCGIKCLYYTMVCCDCVIM